MKSQPPPPPAPAAAAQASAASLPLLFQLQQLQFMERVQRQQAEHLADRVGMLQAQALDHRARAAALQHQPPSPERDQLVDRSNAEAQLCELQSAELVKQAVQVLATLYAPGGAAPGNTSALAGSASPTPPPPKPAWQRAEFWEALWKLTQGLAASMPLADKHKATIGERAYGALRHAHNLLAKASAQAQRAQAGADLGAELAELLGEVWQRLESMPWHLLDVSDGVHVQREIRALTSALPPYKPKPFTPGETAESLAAEIVAAMLEQGAAELPNAQRALEQLKAGQFKEAEKRFSATTPPAPLLYDIRRLSVLLLKELGQ